MRKNTRFTHDMTFLDAMYVENVLDGTESWFLTMAWVYPLPPNSQQARHGISIRQSLGDKGFPTPDPNFGKAVLKVKHSFARVQNSRVRGTTSTTG